MAKIVKVLKWGGVVLALAVLTLLSLRVYDVQRGPPLARWHTYVPHELRAKELDAADWSRYLAEEDRVFQAVRDEVSRKLDADERIPINRYFEGSPVYPPILPRTSTDPTCWSRMARRWARWCSCMA